MILTDREIRASLKNRQIVIDPEPSAERFSSTSVDLTLHENILVWKRGNLASQQAVVTPGRPGYSYQQVRSEWTEQQNIRDGCILQPGDFVLGWTVERVSLPVSSRFAARVEGKSSLARLALVVHMTAPTIHAGFDGQIQLEICNHGPLKIELLPGMPVCQLILEMVYGTPEAGYSGMFGGQSA